MANESIDDEWERSEQALKQLKIEPQLQDQAVFFPSSSTCEIGGDENGSNGLVNDALLDALQNPRERMNVLKYEDRILRFVKSSDSFLDVPPISNSYQRLLIYKVAERFGLEHNPSETMNELGDRGILFLKTPSTAVPSVLLINYKGEELKMESAVSASAPPNPSKGPKIVVMQRRNNKPSTSNQKSNSSEKNQISASEREKAYAAARARIFGEDASPEPTTSTATPSPPGVKATQDNLREQNPVSSTRGKCIIEPQSQPKTKQSASPRLVQVEETADQLQKKKVVDPGNWKEKKVLLRDKQAERYDPDFARFPSGSPAYQASSPTLNVSAPSYQSIPPVYPNVLHQPPTNIAPSLSSPPVVAPMQNWNGTTHINMMPGGSQAAFTPYDYQHHPGAYHTNYSFPHSIPVAPGLPEHLTKSPSPKQALQQSSYNKDFPPLG